MFFNIICFVFNIIVYIDAYHEYVNKLNLIQIQIFHELQYLSDVNLYQKLKWFKINLFIFEGKIKQVQQILTEINFLISVLNLLSPD